MHTPQDTFTRKIAPAVMRQRPFALRCLRCPHDADDIIQSALLRAWRYRDRFDPSRGTPAAWARVIVRSEISRLYDRRGRRPEHSWEPEAIDRSHAETWEAEAEIDGAREREAIAEAVAAALDDLPDERREVLMLTHWDDMSPREIAERQGCALGTVGSRASRARRSLLDSLAHVA